MGQSRQERKIHAKFDNKNIHRIPKTPGFYQFFDENGTKIYVGSASKDLRHRVESYNEVDDFGEHPTKQALRPHIDTFTVHPMGIAKARKREEMEKQGTRFNADNKMNEAKKHVDNN